jgi:hypothetical protein
MYRYRYKAYVDDLFYTFKCILDDSILHQYYFFYIPRSQACVASQVHPKGRKSGLSWKKR